MKQTAVEWYAEQIQLKEKFTQEEFDNITNQAKEMEKQQIIDACEKFGNLNGVDIEDYKQYYNEAYNK